MTPSTINSGEVCSQARTAKANPCETITWADSAPQAIKMAAKTMDGKVYNADQAWAFDSVAVKMAKDWSL